MTFWIISRIILSYILGSIPSAVWVGKLFRGTDVREHGSGNAGATNTFRVLGARVGVPVLIMDVLKGLLATQLAYANLFGFQAPIDKQTEYALLFGLLAVAGHIFPLFARFKGGKGIATFFGVILGIHAWSALISMGLFIGLVASTRYVSLGSLIGAILYPVQLLLLFKLDGFYVSIFAILIPVVVLITHRKNVIRLLNGEENRVKFAKNSS